MPVNPDPNSGWASWLSQFLPQVGAPQPGNILNSPAAGPSAGQIQVGAPQPGNIINSPAAGPSLGRLGLPQFMGGNGLYQSPGPPTQLPGATPATPVGGASGAWAGPGGRGGIGSDARFPMTGLGGASGSWGPATPAGTATATPGGIGSDYVAGGAPVSGAPPNTSASGGGIGGDWRYPTAAAPGTGGIGSDFVASARTAPGRPAPVASAPAGAMAQNSPFVQIARPNAPPNAGPYGAATPKMTALDLSRLFGRRVA